MKERVRKQTRTQKKQDTENVSKNDAYQETDNNNIPTHNESHGNPVDQESMPPENSITNKPSNNTELNTPNNDSLNNSDKTYNNEGDTDTSEDNNDEMKLPESNTEQNDHKDDTTPNDQNGRYHTDTITKNHSYSTRAKKPLQYNKVCGSDYQFALILAQMSAAKGIKLFGQKAIDALADEWSQLDSLSVFQGREYGSLTSKERKEALSTVQLKNI